MCCETEWSDTTLEKLLDDPFVTLAFHLSKGFEFRSFDRTDRSQFAFEHCSFYWNYQWDIGSSFHFSAA
ncbi:hypothetical protein CEXT_558181 [Caerostris extrusa]|uniref:Uncharacterized protein n=1 Tax=Caerostris extrusa TaxID=172846 RepID=A0AAV4WDE6_CAEEX|nr:hypothetical protein CEXT_558181 [Caerostris extrusa]